MRMLINKGIVPKGTALEMNGITANYLRDKDANKESNKNS